MSQLNDAIMDALSAFDGTINDRLVAYYKSLAIPGNTLTDLEYNYVDMAIVDPKPSHRNDLWFAYLRGKGHTGSLNDMLLQYWIAGAETGEMKMGLLRVYLENEGWIINEAVYAHIDIQYDGGFVISRDDLINHVQGTVPSALWNDIINGLAEQGY